MINITYRADVKSELGNDWQLDLRPANMAAGSTREMRTSAEGFSLSYKGSGDNFTQPIRGSELSMIMIIRNTDDEEYISDIATEQDQTYMIQLKKWDGAVYQNYWTGYVWADTIQISYAAYPYTAVIRASDSIARYREYKGYPYNTTPIWGLFQMVLANYSPSGSISQDGNIIPPGATTGANQKIRLGTTYTSGDSDPSETNLWYYMPKLGTETYSGDINTSANRLGVLSDWLSNWGCTMFLEDGYYKIMEFRDRNTGEVTWAEHDSNGDPTGTETTENLTIQVGTTHKILSGGKFFFKRANRASELVYVNTVGSSGATSTDTRTFPFGGNERNVALLDTNFGTIWSNQLKHYLTPTGSQTDITNNIGNNTTTGPASLVDIFQDNMEWFFSLPQKYFSGSVRGPNLNFGSTLVIGKEIYVANNITLSAATDEWEGEWVKIGEEDNVNWLSKTSLEQIDSQTSGDNIIFKE